MIVSRTWSSSDEDNFFESSQVEIAQSPDHPVALPLADTPTSAASSRAGIKSVCPTLEFGCVQSWVCTKHVFSRDFHSCRLETRHDLRKRVPSLGLYIPMLFAPRGDAFLLVDLGEKPKPAINLPAQGDERSLLREITHDAFVLNDGFVRPPACDTLHPAGKLPLRRSAGPCRAA